jgi:multiple antibiotic resistance protein
MTDWPQLLLLSVLGVNPAGAIAGYLATVRRFAVAERFPLALIAAGAAALLVLGVAALSEPLRDALETEPSTFRIAAGVVLLLAGGQACWRGYAAVTLPGPGWQAAIYPLALPLVVGPGIIAILMHGATAPGAGAGVAIGAALPVAAVTAFVAPFGPVRLAGMLRGVARGTGAVAVVAAVALIVDGVQSV